MICVIQRCQAQPFKIVKKMIQLRVFDINFSERESSIQHVIKIFVKANISYPVICTRNGSSVHMYSAYQGVRSVSFSINFVYVPNGCIQMGKCAEQQATNQNLTEFQYERTITFSLIPHVHLKIAQKKQPCSFQLQVCFRMCDFLVDTRH